MKKLKTELEQYETYVDKKTHVEIMIKSGLKLIIVFAIIITCLHYILPLVS